MLKDKVAIVTGGAQGIGKAIATRFAEQSCRVVVSDIDGEQARATAERITTSHKVKCVGVTTNVVEPEQCKNLINRTLQEFDRIDILVNNAGITRDQLLMKMSDGDWNEVLAVNLTGAFNCCRAVVRQMMKQRCGSIINISSVVGLFGNPGQVNYAASKAGLIGLTKTLAKELAARSIRVNAVAPGFISTRMTDALPETAKETIIRQVPLHNFGQPEDVANAVFFLASDMAKYITGEVIKVDGGLMM